jgi:hypothetical protein
MIYLFNTNIIPDEAVVRVKEVTAEKIKAIIEKHDGNFTSAIGHEASAKAFSALIGYEIPTNRINAQPIDGDIAFSLKLNGRLAEGVILSEKEMEVMGYTLFKMEFYNVDKILLPF